jgi:hypothetical protein
MPKFAVTVRRVEYREHTFEVEADNSAQAEEEVFNSDAGASDHDWRDSPVCHADEEVVTVSACSTESASSGRD